MNPDTTNNNLLIIEPSTKCNEPGSANARRETTVTMTSFGFGNNTPNKPYVTNRVSNLQVPTVEDFANNRFIRINSSTWELNLKTARGDILQVCFLCNNQRRNFMKRNPGDMVKNKAPVVVDENVNKAAIVPLERNNRLKKIRGSCVAVIATATSMINSFVDLPFIPESDEKDFRVNSGGAKHDYQIAHRRTFKTTKKMERSSLDYIMRVRPELGREYKILEKNNKLKDKVSTDLFCRKVEAQWRIAVRSSLFPEGGVVSSFKKATGSLHEASTAHIDFLKGAQDSMSRFTSALHPSNGIPAFLALISPLTNVLDTIRDPIIDLFLMIRLIRVEVIDYVSISLLGGRLLMNAAFAAYAGRFKWIKSFFFPTPQIDAAELDEFAKMPDDIASSPMIGKLAAIITGFLSTHLFGTFPDAVRTAFEVTKKYIWMGGTDIGFFLKVCECVTFIGARVTEFIKTGDFFDLLGVNKEEIINKELNALNAEILAWIEGNAPSDQTRFSYIEKRLALLNIRLINKPNSVLVSLYNKVKAGYDYFQQSNVTSMIMPTGIILAGDSGTGKTSIVEALEDYMRISLNIPEGVKIVLTYQVEISFQNIPCCTKIVVINDALQTKDEKFPMMSLMQQLTDNQPPRLNAASLEEKSRSIVKPHMTIITTNASHYSFTSSTGGSEKFTRRYVGVQVKWTQAAIEFADKHAFPVSEFWKHNHKFGGYTFEPVIYTVFIIDKPLGEKISNGISFIPTKETTLMVYNNRNDLIAHLIKHHKDCRQTTPFKTIDHCPCGIGSSNGACEHIDENDIDLTKHKSSLTDRNLRAKLQAGDIKIHQTFATPEGGYFSKMSTSRAETMNTGESELVELKDLDLVEWGLDPTLFTVEDRLNFDEMAISVRSNGGRIPDFNKPNYIILRGARAKFGHINVEFGISSSLLNDKVYASKYLRQLYPFGKRIGDGIVMAAHAPQWITMELLHPDVDEEENVTLGKRIVAATAALGTILSVYLIVISVTGSQNELAEGSLHGVLLNVPKDDKHVQQIATKLVPWMGTSAKPFITPMNFEICRNGMRLHAILVCHNLLMLPKHFFYNEYKLHVSLSKDIVDGEVFTVNINGAFYTEKFNVRNYVCADEYTDIAFYHFTSLPSQWQFAYDSMYMDVKENSVVSFKDASQIKIKYDQGGNYTGNYPSKGGDCGIALLDDKGFVLGMHVAAFMDYKIAMPVTRTIVDKAIGKFSLKNIHITKQDMELPPSMESHMQTLKTYATYQSDFKWLVKETEDKNFPVVILDCVPVGTVPFRNSSLMTCHTTTLHYLFKDRCAVYVSPFIKKAIEINGVYTSPVTKRIRVIPYTAIVDQGLMLKAVQAMVDELSRANDGDINPISLNQALLGSLENQFLGPKDHTKSNGPYMQFRKISKKETFKECSPGMFEVHQEWLDREKFIKDKIYLGLIPILMCSASIKDECIKQEDVEKKAKARYFVVHESNFNTVLTEIVGPLLAALINDKESGIAAAMNPASTAWNDLYLDLKKFGSDKGVIECDQSAFDIHHSTIIEFIILFFVLYSKKMGYGEKDVHATSTVLRACFRYMITLEGNWMLNSSKLASGLKITLVFNSLATKLLVYYAFYALKLEESIKPRDVLTVKTVGDDLLMSVSKDWRTIFTIQHLVKCQLECGYEVTAATKGESIIEYIDLEQATFLKRNFLYNDEYKVWVGPLAKESIYKSLCYCTGKFTSQEQLDRDRGTAFAAAREMALHGRADFEELLSILPEEYRITFTYNELMPLLLTGKEKVWNTLANLETDSTSLRGADSSIDASFFGLKKESRLLFGGVPQSDNEVSARSGASGLICSTELNSTVTETITSPVDQVTNLTTTATDVVTTTKVAAPNSAMEAIQIDQIFHRKRKIDTWSITGATFSTDIGVLSRYLNVPQIAAVMAGYRFFKGDPVLTFVVTGTSTVQGSIRVWCFPAIHVDEYSGDVTQYPYDSAVVGTGGVLSSQLPGFVIDFSKPASKEIRLPFPSNRDYIKIGAEDDWQVGAQTIAPVFSAYGVTPAAMKVDVYLHYENVDLQVIQPQSETSGTLFSQRLEYARRLSKYLIQPYSSVVDQLLHLGSATAQSMGYSRPPNEANEQIIVRTKGNYALADGLPDGVTHLGLHSCVSTNQSVVGIPLHELGDTSMKFWKNKEAVMEPSWSEGEVLTMIPNRIATATLADGVVYNRTPLYYLSSMFANWCGELRIKVLIFSSPVVRARIGFVIIPPGVDAPLIFPYDGDFITHTVDVMGSTEVIIDVPYLHVRPFIPVVDRGTSSALNFDDTRMVYYYLTPVVGPIPVPPTPFIQVLISGPGVEFMTPDLTNANHWVPQGKSETQSGEIIEDLMLLTRRGVSVMDVLASAGTNPDTLALPTDGIYPTNPDSGSIGIAGFERLVTHTAWSFYTYIREPYVGYRGSSIYRFMILSSPNPHQCGSGVSYQGAPSRGRIRTNLNRGSTWSGFSDDFIEVCIPERTVYKFKTPRKNYLGILDYSCVQLMQPLPSANRTAFSVVHSAGDDVVFSGFLAIPAMKYRDNPL